MKAAVSTEEIDSRKGTTVTVPDGATLTTDGTFISLWAGSSEVRVGPLTEQQIADLLEDLEYLAVE